MNNTVIINTKTFEYAYHYASHGIIPDTVLAVAYRRSGRPVLASRKLIKCPHCRELLTHVDRNTVVRMYGIPKGKKKDIPGLIIRRCSFCKADVGMVMTV